MESNTPALRAQLTDGQANSVYNHAYHLSMKGDHERAAALLALLSNYRPQEARYFHAGAVCCRQMGLYEDAMVLLSRAMQLRPGDDSLAFQQIECLMLMHREDDARERLLALADPERPLGDAQSRERALTLLALMGAAQEPVRPEES